MNPLTFLVGQWAFMQVYQRVEKKLVTERAYEYARSVGKPVLDFGCGDDPRGDYNLDVVQRRAPNFIKVESFEAPRIPFYDKFFGSALCLHVLEHVDDPDYLIRELSRVADRIFVVTPRALYWRTWFNGEHKWVFIGDTQIRNPFYSHSQDSGILYPE